jgi:hypothetical protein
MLDWIGSLRIRETTQLRIVLSLSWSTRVVGMMVFCSAIYLAYLAWPVSRWLAIAPAVLAGLGALLATVHRRLVFDREAGVLRVEQRVFGLASRAVVPLFHLRAVVIRVRTGESGSLPGLSSERYIAYVERRVGEDIYLDESRRCAYLLRMAEDIADLAELRLEYDATSRAARK